MVRLLAVGFVLAVLAAAWIYFGSSEGERSNSGTLDQSVKGDTSSRSAPGTARQAQPPGARLPAPVRMTAKNAPPAVPPEATTMSLAQAFASEAPSAVASTERTEMIRGVVEGLVTKKVGDARISALECRTRHCLLRISGDDSKGVVALVDALQDERGFLGKAESLMMGRDEESIHIYLRFAE